MVFSRRDLYFIFLEFWNHILHSNPLKKAFFGQNSCFGHPYLHSHSKVPLTAIHKGYNCMHASVAHTTCVTAYGTACSRVQVCVADYVTACMCVCVAGNAVHMWHIMPVRACLWGTSNLRSSLCDYMCGRYTLCDRMCDCMHACVEDEACVAEYATACILV